MRKLLFISVLLFCIGSVAQAGPLEQQLGTLQSLQKQIASTATAVSTLKMGNAALQKRVDAYNSKSKKINTDVKDVTDTMAKMKEFNSGAKREERFARENAIFKLKAAKPGQGSSQQKTLTKLLAEREESDETGREVLEYEERLPGALKILQQTTRAQVAEGQDLVNALKASGGKISGQAVASENLVKGSKKLSTEAKSAKQGGRKRDKFLNLFGLGK